MSEQVVDGQVLWQGDRSRVVIEDGKPHVQYHKGHGNTSWVVSWDEAQCILALHAENVRLREAIDGMMREAMLACEPYNKHAANVWQIGHGAIAGKEAIDADPAG